jgi:hypothetical protein
MNSSASKKRQPSNNNDSFDRYFAVLGQAQHAVTAQTLEALPTIKIDIEEEIAREQKIKNDDAEQDIRLKRQTLQQLFALLFIETILIFMFAFLQATGLFGFRLEEWSFKLLCAVTIAQITVMLMIAVKYLFPQRKGRS